jgi:ABC-type glycerol-3-phosphate transport system permease component
MWTAYLVFLIFVPNKSSTTVEEAIVQILSASIRPMILQSDNEFEFLGALLFLTYLPTTILLH